METDVPSVSPAPARSDITSLLLGLAAAGLLIRFGMRHRTVFGTAAGIAGAGVLGALVAPRLAPRVSRRAGRTIELNTEFVVERPQRAVFDFFRNFENFPLLGGLLHSVEDFDDGRSLWRVMGRGTLVEWQVIVTKYVPPRVIGWESVAGAAVESSGMLRFEALDASTTRVGVALHYRPVSDAAARAFHGLLVGRSERRVRAAIERVDAAMQRALEPDVHRRTPRYPLPESPVAAMTPPPSTTHASSNP